MTIQELLHQLETLGTERNRKTSIARGSGQNTFGVSSRILKKIARDLGQDNELAVALWDSEIIDAQALAIMIANPKIINAATINKWMSKLEYSPLVNALSRLVVKTKFANDLLKKWIETNRENIKSGGYLVLSHLLKQKARILEKADLERIIQKIKQEIESSSSPTRMAMRKALRAISAYEPALAQKSMKVTNGDESN